MSKRKSLSKKIRFEVFKRDSFTCQYCGRKAPDVELEVDHIKPVAKGGTNDIMNLVTSCVECNRGKRDKTLNDNTVVEKQRTELERLQARNEQLEMMLKWKESLESIEDKEIQAIYDTFERRTGSGFNENGKRTIRKLIKRYGFGEVLECVTLSIDEYYTTEEDWENTFSKVERIAKVRKDTKDNPSLLYKNRLTKYFSKKFGENNVPTFKSKLNLITVDEMNTESIFEVMKTSRSPWEVYDILDEIYGIELDYQNYLEWCNENGD